VFEAQKGFSPSCDTALDNIVITEGACPGENTHTHTHTHTSIQFISYSLILQIRQGASAGPWHQTHQVQWTLRDVKSQGLRRGSRVNNVQWRDENSSIRSERRRNRCSVYHKTSIRRKRRGERCSVHPKHHPAAYKPIAASLGAGPGETDSALTITNFKDTHTHTHTHTHTLLYPCLSSCFVHSLCVWL